MYLEVDKEEIYTFSSLFVKYWIEDFCLKSQMFDVRLNAEGPEKFGSPKNGPFAPMTKSNFLSSSIETLD